MRLNLFMLHSMLVFVAVVTANGPSIGFHASPVNHDATSATYLARFDGGSITLAGGMLTLRAGASPAADAGVSLRWKGSATLQPREPLPGRLHFLIGDDPAAYATGIEHFGRILVADASPGIDLVVSLTQGEIEYDLLLRDGADLSGFEFGVEGGGRVVVNDAGDLVTTLGGHDIVQRAPHTFVMDHSGARRAVASRFEMRGERRVGFVVAPRQDAEVTVIDPGIATSTFLGSTLFDEATAVVLDVAGGAIVCGTTNAATFPVTSGSYDTSFGGTFSDAFVAKLSPTGALVFATFLGGSGTDAANAIALGPDGRIHVAGRTQSTNFPTSSGVYDATQSGGIDGFCAALAADGKTLAYGTYLGGSADDEVTGLAIGSGNEIFVTGYTGSVDFPSSVGAFDTTFNGAGPFLADGFLVRFPPLAQGLTFATFLGGTVLDEPRGIALSLGTPVVVGRTESADFPIFGTSLDATFGFGVQDGFLAHFDALGTTLTYSSFAGGADFDGLECVTTHADGRIFAAGYTRSPDTVIPNGFDLSPGGVEDGLLYAFSASDLFSFGSYLGGAGDDRILGIEVDIAGATYVTGRTTSADFPALQVSYDSTPNGGTDAFFTKFKAAGAGLNESGYLGGTGYDEGRGIAVDDKGAARLVGRTTSANFPIVAGAPQITIKGSSDAFVTTLPTATCSNPPTVLTYGSGKAGSTGIPTLTGVNLPAIPSTSFILRINGALPGAVPILFVGASPLALPFDGGTFLVNPIFSITLFPIGPTGRLDLPVVFGDNANLCALKLDMQAIYIDPAAAGFHHTAQTNGLEIVLGS